MTQIRSSLDLLPSTSGHAGSLTLTGGPSPAASSRGRSKGPAADLLGPAFMRDPKLAPRLLRLAERSGLLPASGQNVRRLPHAELRALQAPGKSEESLLKLELITSRRHRTYLQALAVHDGLLPKPTPARSPSPLGPRTERNVSPPRNRERSVERSRVRLLGQVALASKIAALVRATPGEAARSLLDPDFEAVLRRHAANEEKMLLLPASGPRYLLVRLPNPKERAAAQARIDRLDFDELVARYDLTPYAKPQMPKQDASSVVSRFNTYGVADERVAQRIYSWEELEGAKGLGAALALNFDPAQAKKGSELKKLFATEGALPRLVAKKPAVAGVRRRLAGHQPVVLFNDTPEARAHFAAQDAAEARALRLRLNLDTGGPQREGDMRPMLGFAEQV